MTRKPAEVVQKNPLIAVLATFLASGGIGALGFEHLGGGADAKVGIATIIEMTETQVKAANAERDRVIAALVESKALYQDCNAARLRAVP